MALTWRERGVLALGLLLLTALLAGLLVPPGAGAGPPSTTPSTPLGTERVLRLGLQGPATTVDPLYAATPAERDLAALLFRGLVRLGPGSTVVGDLASSWEISADGRTYTFHLRPDAQWLDGVPVTSGDVAFTVRTLQDPAYDGPNGASWQNVSVETPDDATVVLRLTDPAAGFLYAATQRIVPEHVLADLDITTLRASAFEIQPVSDGAFRLVSLDLQGARLERLTAAPGQSPATSFDPLAPLPQASAGATDPASGLAQLPVIQVRFFETGAEMASALRGGQLDMAGGLDPEATAALASTSGFATLRYPQAVLSAAILNVRSDQPLFRDVRVRQALLEAIDREAIVREALGGAGSVATSPYPPATADLPAPSSPLPTYGPKGAAGLLTAAGWKRQADGWHRPAAKDPVTFEVVTVSEADNAALYAVAQRVVAAWTALGLKVTLSALKAGDLVQGRLLRHDFQAAVVDMNLGLDPDLMPLLTSSEARRGGSNLSGYQNVALDRQLVAAHAYADATVRGQRLAAVRTSFATQLPFLPLVFADRVEVFTTRLSGPSSRQLGSPSDRFWDVLAWRLAGAP